jgi:hypothetical protein
LPTSLSKKTAHNNFFREENKAAKRGVRLEILRLAIDYDQEVQEYPLRLHPEPT